MNNEERLKEKTKKPKFAFYLAVGLGLLFFAFSFIAWNNAVKDTVHKQSAEEQLVQEESFRANYISKMDSYFKTEDRFDEIAAERGYSPGNSPRKGVQLREFVEFLDQFVVMEKEKMVYMRNTEPPLNFAVSQAKNVNATTGLIVAVEDLKEAVNSDDEKAIADAETRIGTAFKDLETAELSFKTAIDTSQARLDEKRKELGTK